MNYKETLSYLFSKLPMFTRVGEVAYKPNLDNTIALCKSLNNPQEKFKSIHIAGTNGKGSCSHFIASVFQEAGYKTALYTSPHINEFTERIKIDGEEIDEQWVVSFVKKVRPQIELLKPSFFEVTVAMAFSYFAEKEVDIAIIETGLGGLLDSTNIIKPILSIITNISYDHTNLLGNTLAEIAQQKAGIIKPNIPVVIGETSIVTKNIFIEAAQNNHSSLVFADQTFEIISTVESTVQMDITLKHIHEQCYINISIDLVGAYQLMNIKTVLTAISLLKDKWKITEENIIAGLKNTKKNTDIRGRFEVLKQQPTVIADVAHNEAGLKAVFKQVLSMAYENLYVITAFVSDKDVDKTLNIFPKSAFYFFTQADIPRAMPYLKLANLARSKSLSGIPIATPRESIAQALSKAKANDLILITGSFFILAEVYSYLDSIKK